MASCPAIAVNKTPSLTSQGWGFLGASTLLQKNIMKIAPKEKQIVFIRELLGCFDRINGNFYRSILCNYSNVVTLDENQEVQLAEDANDIEVHHFNVFLQTFNVGFMVDLGLLDRK
jgi:hypothetical protein